MLPLFKSTITMQVVFMNMMCNYTVPRSAAGQTWIRCKVYLWHRLMFFSTYCCLLWFLLQISFSYYVVLMSLFNAILRGEIKIFLKKKLVGFFFCLFGVCFCCFETSLPQFSRLLMKKPVGCLYISVQRSTPALTYLPQLISPRKFMFRLFFSQTVLWKSICPFLFLACFRSSNKF